MLLPQSATYVREQSLHRHLALATSRAGKDNGDLLAELVKALYLACMKAVLEKANCGTRHDLSSFLLSLPQRNTPSA